MEIHFPEPLEGWSKVLLDSDGKTMAKLRTAAEASRIAACVNACSGIATPHLKQTTLISVLSRIEELAEMYAAEEGVKPEVPAALQRLANELKSDWGLYRPGGRCKAECHTRQRQ